MGIATSAIAIKIYPTAITHLYILTACAAPPPPPTNVQVVERTEHSITLTWDPPLGSDAGDNITYAVYTSGNNRPRTEAYRGTATMATIESELYTN